MNIQSASAAIGNRLPVETRKILVVDDNDANRLVTGLMLEMLGYDHEEASNGREALDRLEKNTYAAVLMDIRMPEMDGLETTRCIRKFEQGRAMQPLPIIAVTAEAGSLSKARCMDAGMNGFITKPYTSVELAETVAQWLEPVEAATH